MRIRVFAIAALLSLVTASFAIPTRLSAAQTASPFVRVYPSDTSGLTLPETKGERSIAPFFKIAAPAKFRGEFVIDLTVGLDGRATDGLVKSYPVGSEKFASALLSSMSEWTYEPGRLSGVAVPVRMELRMTFDYSRIPDRLISN
jgi:hypothetical protein